MICLLRIRESDVSVMGFRGHRAGTAGLGRGGTGAMPRTGRRRAVLSGLAGLLALAGCASTQVPMNQPQPNPAGNGTAYRLDSVNARGGAPDLLMLVSFSGGGKRSAAFAHGALRGLRDIELTLEGRRGRLLDEVDQIAGVSGGSFPAAHYGLNGDRHFETFGPEFLDVDINAYIFGTYLLPWHWEWLVNPLYGTNDRMADIYDRLMFHGATFDTLIARGRPQVSINATDFSFGTPFSFTAYNFDLICSEFGSFPLARAVAASNGFPVLFSPVTLQNHRGADCRVPVPDRPDPALIRANPRTRRVAQTMERYLDSERTPWIHLMDGGIADNLAMRATLNNLLIVQGQLRNYATQLARLRRVLVLSVDGQAAADPSYPRRRVVGGLATIFSGVSGGQIDNYNIETLVLADDEVQTLVRDIRELRCRSGARLDGYRCDDVQGAVIHLALADYPDAAARARLELIPTGLSIDAADVQALVAAGESMVKNSPELRRFLDGMTPPPATDRVAARRPAR